VWRTPNGTCSDEACRATAGLHHERAPIPLIERARLLAHRGVARLRPGAGERGPLVQDAMEPVSLEKFKVDVAVQPSCPRADGRRRRRRRSPT
jgi:hypothetical protein